MFMGIIKLPVINLFFFIKPDRKGHADLFPVDAGNTNQIRAIMAATPRQNMKTALSKNAIIE
jgi:hypothetical protein